MVGSRAGRREEHSRKRHNDTVQRTAVSAYSEMKTARYILLRTMQDVQ